MEDRARLDDFSAMMAALDELRTRPVPPVTPRELVLAWVLMCLLARG